MEERNENPEMTDAELIVAQSRVIMQQLNALTDKEAQIDHLTQENRRLHAETVGLNSELARLRRQEQMQRAGALYQDHTDRMIREHMLRDLRVPNPMIVPVPNEPGAKVRFSMPMEREIWKDSVLNSKLSEPNSFMASVRRFLENI